MMIGGMNYDLPLSNRYYNDHERNKLSTASLVMLIKKEKCAQDEHRLQKAQAVVTKTKHGRLIE